MFGSSLLRSLLCIRSPATRSRRLADNVAAGAPNPWPDPSFFTARGRVVGKGADKGLENAATVLVKWAIVAAVAVIVAGVCGRTLLIK